MVLDTGPTDGTNGAVVAATGEDTAVAAAGASGEGSSRPPRLPRWTRQEILVLIQGKRVAESRVRRGGRASAGGGGALEPKWESVSSYCGRHGVNRGPVQCRKRWSNLAGDFRKIKEWESQASDGSESFWVMRNDLRREKKLPGFFDREVYDILDGAAAKAEEEVEVTVAVLDGGRPAAADEGLFSSDNEQSAAHEDAVRSPDKEVDSPAAPIPVSERRCMTPDQERQDEPSGQELSSPGKMQGKKSREDHEIGATSKERKRKWVSPEGIEISDLQEHLIEVLERNSRMLAAQFEVQNRNMELDRDQRKEYTESLVGALSKLADAIGRIADKL